MILIYFHFSQSSKYVNGKAIAYGALCRLICRHYKSFPAAYPSQLLPYFYATIHRVLFFFFLKKKQSFKQ